MADRNKGNAQGKRTFWDAFTLFENGRLKSTFLLYSFALAFVLLAIHIVAYAVLLGPIDSLTRGWTPMWLVNAMQALIPAVAGSAVCMLFFPLFRDKRLLPAAYGWLEALVLPVFIIVLATLEAQDRLDFLRIALPVLLLPLGLGFGVSCLLCARQRREARPRGREKGMCMNEAKASGALDLARAVRDAYARGQTDYTMAPLVAIDADGVPLGKIKEKDTVVFCCRRGEREIELTEMFTDPHFDRVDRKWLRGLNFVILTLYHEKFRHLPIAFQPQQLPRPLSQIISEAGRTQLHCAESEKYAHVTFFFNGGNNEPFPGEEDVCISSPKGIDFVNKPELSLPEVVEDVSARLGKHDFVVVNFANGDIIGHTADAQAKVSAAEHVSRQLGRLVDAAREKDYVIAITADHGNLEVMTTPEGLAHVAHTRNLVPFMLIDPRHDGPIDVRDGSLCDVAPTVLDIMGIPKPAEMTAESLVKGHAFGAKRKVLLIILDGWGYGAQDDTNPIFLGHTPAWDTLVERYAPSRLHASDGYVGLGEGKAGNSEAGHLNLGAGRVVVQDDVRLDKAMADGTFEQNPVLLKAIAETRRRKTALHLLAFLTESSSHGSIEYALAICRMAKDLPEVYLHMIFDGRSTTPGSVPQMLERLDTQLKEIGAGQVVDGVGRGIVLERDKNYAKVKLGYDAMVLGKGTRYPLSN